MTKSRDNSRLIQNTAIIIPSGTTGQRPTASNGYFRFNTTTSSFEGYTGGVWGAIGGSSDANTAIYNANTSTTGFLAIPQGTTAQRPANAANGAIRWNTSNSAMEVYVAGNTGWATLTSTTYAIDYLIIAGGGGGGGLNGGAGGGAGGIISGSGNLVSPNQSYTVTVGSGGAAGSTTVNGVNGLNSSFGLLGSALGGGYGQTQNGAGTTGGPGGSGGGGQGNGGANVIGSPGGSGTAGQGNNGGAGWFNSGNDGGGAGGGAGAAGGNASSNQGGQGGVGTNSYSPWASATSTGASGYYAGGGGGGSYSGPNTSGGTGGGGGGRQGSTSTNGIAGTSNTGGGGGGGYNGGQGGSGLLIVRYLGSQRGTGGTIVTTGGYTYHTFTSSGIFTA
jgi:hypothetical protein